MLESRHAWCAAQGIPYVMLVVPEKHVIYPDLLPDGYAISPDRPINQIAGALSSPMREALVYPAQALIDGRSSEETWLKTDVHWTGWGAYIGYLALMEAINRHIPIEPLKPEGLVRTDRNLIGDLGIRLDPEVSEDAISYGYNGAGAAPRVYGSLNYSAGQVEISENGRPGSPTCVMFRDSNATTLLPYLAPHFSRLVTIASAELFHEVVRAERPDLVITQTTERQLARPIQDEVPDVMLFPNDFGDAGFEFLSGVKLPLPPTRNSQLISFHAQGNSQPFRGDGWSWQEGGHVWMEGDASHLRGLPVPVPGLAMQLRITGYPATTPDIRAQRLELHVAGQIVGEISVERYGEHVFVIPGALTAERTHLDVTIHHPDAYVPAEVGTGTEQRRLAYCTAHILLRAEG
jgi:hypothetical protein